MTFNRTIVELKLPANTLYDGAISFNRTIVELKHGFDWQSFAGQPLLIVPLWN